MAKKKTSTPDETPKTIDPIVRVYTFPDLEISLEATSLEEATAKAKKVKE